MGTVSETKVERNAELYNDYVNFYKQGKMSILEIMQKYGLSQARIYYLINRMRESLEK